jgi:hypothetical protein
MDTPPVSRGIHLAMAACLGWCASEAYFTGPPRHFASGQVARAMEIYEDAEHRGFGTFTVEGGKPVFTWNATPVEKK